MKRRYQEGGNWQEGMMKSRMATAAALGNPSAIRMTQLHPLMYTFNGSEGTDVPAGATGTHYMASMGEYAVPFIQEKKGKLVFNKKANFRDKEAIQFNTPEEAEYFAEHYKDVAPMMREFSHGGYKADSPDRNNPYNIIPSGRITMQNVPHPVMGIDNMGNRQVMMPGGEYQFPGQTVFEIPIKNQDMSKLKKYQQGGKPTKFEYIHEDRHGNKFTLHKGNKPLSEEQVDYLVERSRALPWNPQATGASLPSQPLWYVPPPSVPIPGEPQAPMMMQPGAPIAAVKKNGGYSGTYSNGVYFANGGPVYPIGGSGPMYMRGGATMVHPFAMNPGPGTGGGMLEEYARERMQQGGVPGAQLVNPFAMNPGPGYGSGMLQEYANEQMRMGGKPCLECGGKTMQQGGVPPGSTPYGFNFGPYETLYGKEVAYPGDTLTDRQLQALATQNGSMERHMGNVLTMRGPDGKHYNYQMSDKDLRKLPHADKRGKLSKFFDMDRYQESYLPAPQQYGGMTMQEDTEQDTDEMKHGGNWIKGAVNPAHKGYCTPMTKSTCTPRRKAFAMTMKKHHGFHHKEYGGEVTQGGNMVRDNEMYAWGGQFHPLARFMQQGGEMNLPPANDGTQNAWTGTGSNYDPATDPNNPVNNPPPMPPQGGYAASQGPAWDETGTTDSQDQQQEEPVTDGPVDNRRERGLGWGYAGAGLAMLGAGMGIASVLSDRRDARNLRNKQFNDRMTSNAFAAQNSPGSMGDYDQYGTFRPNKNTPTKPGAFYPKMSQYGGNFAMGGSYQKGGEYEMSDAEIARLRKMGYKIDLL